MHSYLTVRVVIIGGLLVHSYLTVHVVIIGGLLLHSYLTVRVVIIGGLLVHSYLTVRVVRVPPPSSGMHGHTLFSLVGHLAHTINMHSSNISLEIKWLGFWHVGKVCLLSHYVVGY